MNTVYKNLIAGAWIGDAVVPNVNPSNTADIVGRYAQATAEEVAAAVDAARAALPSWSRTGVIERSGVLSRAAHEVLARADEIGRILAREEGKTLSEATAEVVRAGQTLEYYAAEVLRKKGDLWPSLRQGATVEVTREPVGVVAIITPWNFPIAIPAWKIAPALAHGNTIVFKPAELVPACAWILSDILARAGLPPGVLNLVMGKGAIVGQALVESAGIDAVTFTGSVATGDRVAAVSARLHRKVQLEMGGKNPLVVLDDADLNTAVDCAINGAFYSTGQRCTASSRLIVTRGIHDEFVDLMIDRLQKLVVDDALQPETNIGPVVCASQLEQDEAYIRLGRDEGAELAFGGQRLDREHVGYYLQPALFLECRNSMRICREEIFGPVASVIRADNYDEALGIANDTPFGLSAGICTRSLKYAVDFKRNAEAGLVMVNLPTAGTEFHVPFGGRKRSSIGSREQGAYAEEFFTTVKTAYIAA